MGVTQVEVTDSMFTYVKNAVTFLYDILSCSLTEDKTQKSVQNIPPPRSQSKLDDAPPVLVNDLVEAKIISTLTKLKSSAISANA